MEVTEVIPGRNRVCLRTECVNGRSEPVLTREEFKENEDLPNTSNPDDWAKIAGRKKDRIVAIKPVVVDPQARTSDVERIVTTGQCL